MRQLIVLEAADLKLLHSGATLSLTVNGVLVDLLADRGAARATSAPTKKTGPPATQGGRCEYCGKVVGILYSHVRGQHPDKPLPSYGDLKCPDCGRGFVRADGLRMHRYRMHVAGKMNVNGHKPPKPKARKSKAPAKASA